MAQQTAMQELIEWLQVGWKDEDSETIIKKANQLLLMEKEQIKMAYNDGADHMVESKYEGMDNYYKLRYGSNN